MLEQPSLNILYIEDNPLTREFTTVILENFFKNIIIAIDGEDGFNKFQTHTFDLIITDIDLPKLNGIELIKKIRETDKTIPILITSAHNNTQYFLDGIKYGIQGYILKPLDMEQLSTTVHKIKHQIEEKKHQNQITRLLKQYQDIADKSTIISKTDIEGKITYVNDKFCEISGYTRDELIGRCHNIIKSPDEATNLFHHLWKTIKENKETWRGILKNRNKNGELYYVKATIEPILNDQGEIEEFIGLTTLITNIMHPEKQLKEFLNSLDEAIVVLIQIENFKYIANTLTKEKSQELQEIFAKELFKYMPTHCAFSHIYLLDNGQFVFAKTYNKENIETKYLRKQLKAYQHHINHAKINIGSNDYDLSIITSLAYGKNALENAHIGLEKLFESKQDFIIANALLANQKEESQKKLKTFKMVRKAIDSYNIVSYFQPIVNNKTKKIEKYESLVRLIDEEKNIISPFLFLDTAKEGKYYKEITSIVLTNSFEALYATDMNISINLSALDIEKKETKGELFGLLKKHKKHAHRIVIELLEDERIKDINGIKTFIQQIKQFGVKIAMDDFGAGYSNFKRLLEYQPDFIKIDGSLIQNIEKDEFSRHMVETIVAFAKRQNLQTIAEYVENEKIFDIVCALGVDYSQGYYFGRPGILT